MVVLVLLTLVLAVVALVRGNAAQRQASEAERKANLLREELLELRARLELPPSGRLGQLPPQKGASEAEEILAPTSASPASDLPASAPISPQAAMTPVSSPPRPVWPEDVWPEKTGSPGPAAANAPRPPGLPTPPQPTQATGAARPSLWGPEFSQARISVFGGALVLGGLAFTLRALGLPEWTLLVAVFAFGAVLYGTARLVPWPVSGALRGLAYGVTALGVGSLAQKLPLQWGPTAVLAGLLLLSAALTWDGLRRREPLLGVMAVGGAALSVWMLTDDLGRSSIVAAGLVFLLAAATVAGTRARLWNGTQQAGENSPDDQRWETPDTPQAWRAALALTLGVAGSVPLGWLVTSLHHLPPGPSFDLFDPFGGRLSRDLLARALFLQDEHPWSLALWVGFGLLALWPILSLRRSIQTARMTPGTLPDTEDEAGLRLSVAWATLLPQALVALAVGVALSRWGAGQAIPLGLSLGLSLALSLGLLGVLVAAAYRSWRTLPSPASHLPDPHLPDSQLPASADPEHWLSGTLGSSLTAAATGLAGAILAALLGARSEPSALAGLALALLLVGLYGHSRLWVWLSALALLATALWGLSLPALPTHGPVAPDPGLQDTFLRVLPALLGLLGAVRAAQWRTSHPRTPELAPLAGGCSVILLLALTESGSDGLLIAGTLLASALVWLAHRAPRLPDSVRPTLFWGGLPGSLLGALQLLSLTEPGLERLAFCVPAGIAALVALLSARRAQSAQELVEGLGLGLLALTLALLPGGERPELGVGLALVALLAALLPLKLGGQRVAVLLGLGAAGTLWIMLDHLLGSSSPQFVSWLGAWLVSAVAWLTLARGGRPLLAARLPRHALAQITPLAENLQPWWWAVLLGLSVSAGLLLGHHHWEKWLLAGSAAALLVGVATCVQAARQQASAPARTRWTAGLLIIGAAGIKAASVDALGFTNGRAVTGLAVLVTGLSLLLIAVLAPRPGSRHPTPVSGPESENG